MSEVWAGLPGLWLILSESTRSAVALLPVLSLLASFNSLFPPNVHIFSVYDVAGILSLLHLTYLCVNSCSLRNGKIGRM